jgi:hypothetical protein
MGVTYTPIIPEKAVFRAGKNPYLSAALQQKKLGLSSTES